MAPDKFELMRRNRKRTQERQVRENITKFEQDMVANWHDLMKAGQHAAPERAVRYFIEPDRAPRPWWRRLLRGRAT